MSKEGRTGVTANTPKNILFGAGTIHKGLKYATTWNFTESLVGATSGGSKLSIIPEITKVEVDGALVPAKGLTVKTGEAATMEINFIELTEDIIKASTIGKAGTSEDTNYSAIVSKADIEEGDYWENIAFVGKTLDGKNMEAAGIGGNSQQTQRIIDLLEMLIALLPDTLKDAFESMKFDINNREFARLVKAVN